VQPLCFRQASRVDHTDIGVIAPASDANVDRHGGAKKRWRSTSQAAISLRERADLADYLIRQAQRVPLLYWATQCRSWSPTIVKNLPVFAAKIFQR
jgi:hypothetical protein